MSENNKLEFVVGEEKQLFDLLSANEVMPLLQSAVQSGFNRAAIRDDSGVDLWQAGQQESPAELSKENQGACGKATLFLEGEPVGTLSLYSNTDQSPHLHAVAELLGRTLNALITGNLKRMLTTEMHTQVVNQTYEELVETNQQLQTSEQKYRDLATNLEQRVQERTAELKQMYSRLIQQEKMASIGQMAAGIAHEINNPLGFIHSNLNTLKGYTDRYREMLDVYQQAIAKGMPAEQLQELATEERKRLKLKAIDADIEDIFTESIDGADRVKKIIADLKGFSHIDSLGKEAIDIHREIDRALSVLGHKVPASAQIIRDFGDLPLYLCEGGLFSQLLFNLLHNALLSRSEDLKVLIRTRWVEQSYQLTIADNGPGIPAEILPHIFEPFFTTRPVGQGTGLGLSVAYDTVKNWDGEIRAANAPEGGAIFTVTFPGAAHG